MAQAMICDRCGKTFAAQGNEGWERGEYHIFISVLVSTREEGKRVDLCTACIAELLQPTEGN